MEEVNFKQRVVQPDATSSAMLKGSSRGRCWKEEGTTFYVQLPMVGTV